MRAVLYVLILVVAAWGANTFYQNKKAAHDKAPPPPIITDSAPFAAPEKIDAGPMIPEHLKWTLDPRWQMAEEEGEAIDSAGRERALAV